MPRRCARPFARHLAALPLAALLILSTDVNAAGSESARDTLDRVAPLVHATPLVAKRAVRRHKPQSPPLPPVPDSDGFSEVMPAGPEADGPTTARPGLVVEATATVWALAGSRSWTGCSNVAAEADKQAWNFAGGVNNFHDNHHWAIQAGECPNAPEILAMATRSELMRRFDLPDVVDADTDLSKFDLEIGESRDRALAWIDDAHAELRRRRDLRGFGLEYWRGRALLSTGDFAGARVAFERSLAEGSVEGWKLRRLLALTALYVGDLDAAITLASRAYIDAPNGDRIGSEYVLALVLDRAGDPSGARRHMEAALNRDGDLSQLRTLATAMPTHEILYLHAYRLTARREASGALRLWAAYLARPEPEAPERRLAERHLAAVRPMPTNLSGPAKPGEAP